MQKLSLENTRAIIWDWNGTLLNDLEISIFSMNQILGKLNLPFLSTDKYKSIFTFPVKEYYTAAGIDFSVHDWDTMAHEFIANYRHNLPQATLHEGVAEMLGFFRKKQIKQFILSAMQQDFLMESVSAMNIPFYFDQIVGLNDHYAHTKEENAVLLVNETGLPKENIVMIGDTLHDFEVAQAAGIPCILVACGHQSLERLQSSGGLVCRDLQEVVGLFSDRLKKQKIFVPKTRKQ